ncbi:uncharacterized protein LOC125949556 [Anopheles darlingi]|uniref:uncharacterized protein LOC125949556 n=1 Tax=Anopheles darlingi TaxID=43151 RepID=UPI0021002B9C|nr:uncharacterized protein LOC125949556 [Anopheles darlingi]
MNGYKEDNDPEENPEEDSEEIPEESPEDYTAVGCDPVATFLTSVKCSTNNLNEELKKCSLTYDQISGLVEEDLRLMGVKSDLAIKEILSESSQLPKQRRMYDRVLRTEFHPLEYAETVARNTVEHLESIKVLLNLTQLKLKGTIPENVLLDNHIYASEVSLKLCDRIHDRLSDIQAIVDPNQTTVPNKRTSWIQQVTLPVIFLSGVLLVSICWKRAGFQLI